MVKVGLKNLTKKFGDVIATDNLNLEIKDKEFFVILGPSGGGKSTILNMIAGTEIQDEGSIYFDDECVDDVPPEKRDVAMVFQSYALYPHMKAYQNISFGLENRKVPKGEIQRRVEETAALLRIDHLLKRKPHELSGGERQRVALARAIVREPRVFLLDEPMSNLDAKLRVGMRAELIRIQKSIKTTLIYVTHDQVEAMSMADRIGIMSNGKLIQLGEPMDLFEKPINRFVGGFIGTPPMNFFECVLSGAETRPIIKTDAFELEITGARAKKIRDQTSSSKIILGVRPQNISIYSTTASGRIPSEVYAVEPLGTETVVDLKVNDKIIKAETDPSYSGRIGEKAWFKIDIDNSFFFDGKTEELIQ
ncbi:ABC transporter ATP-binding protein [[Eubacterium] cellulosolvens]